MALPTTISGVDLSDQRGRCGPFLSSAGNVYVVLGDNTDMSILEVWKATDPTSSFSEVDSANHRNHTYDIFNWSVFQVGDVLHIAVQQQFDDVDVEYAGSVYYHTFDMNTDSWGVNGEAVSSAGAEGWSSGYVSIVVRSDGYPVVFYTNKFTKSTMSDYGRAYYARRTGVNSWTSDVSVDAGGAETYYACAAVLGASDRVHFFYIYDNADDLYTRTLDSGNTLQTAQQVDSTIGATARQIDGGAGCSYVSGGSTYICVPYNDASGSTMARFVSADNPTVGTPEAFTTANAKSVSARGSNAPVYLLSAVADDTTLYALWIDSSDSDLYRDSSANGGAWGTDTNTYTGTIVGFTANVYIRGGYYVIGYVVDDNGTVKYDEIQLRAAGPTATSLPIRRAFRPSIFMVQ